MHSMKIFKTQKKWSECIDGKLLHLSFKWYINFVHTVRFEPAFEEKPIRYWTAAPLKISPSLKKTHKTLDGSAPENFSSLVSNL